MKKTVEKEFIQLTDETMSRAEGIKCSLQEFYEGLEILLGEVRTRISIGKEIGEYKPQ